MKKLASDISNWLKEYAISSNRRSFVVGVSGGVDSALVSTLCAMTGLPTHCVILPCQSQDTETIRGCLHINWLSNKFGRYGNGIHSHRIDLTETFNSFTKESEKYYGINELANINTKSRLRMIALYHIATCHGGLVVGTGNKVEDFGIGFFTKYGDGGVDISPIGDMLKSEVRQMCRELDVLSELSEAIPTDGLWNDARTDEQAIGASYDELEWAMDFNEKHKWDSPKTIDSLITLRQLEVLTIYNKLHNAGLHKINSIPIFKRN